VRRNDLPVPVSIDPGIREPVPATKCATRPMAADHQPPRYDCRRTEAMDTHGLVMRGRHCIESSDHVV